MARLTDRGGASGRSRGWLLLVLLVLLLPLAAWGQEPGSDVAREGAVEADDETLGGTSPEAPVASDGEPVGEASREPYRVGPGDVLRVEVYGEDELSGDYTVGADGVLVFPLVGRIAVGGKTEAEVAQLVTELLERDYLFDPKVGVTVKEHKSQQVKVLGNVTKPGIYYLDGFVRLFDLLSRAGGVSPRSGEILRGQTVRIVRQPSASPETPDPPARTIHVDLYELLIQGVDEANVVIEPGDVVYVPTTESIHVIGEVKRPGSYPYEAGMTVLKALSLAGGPTKKASVRGTVVKRIEQGREVKIKVRPEDPIQPQDVLEVPLSFW